MRRPTRSTPRELAAVGAIIAALLVVAMAATGWPFQSSGAQVMVVVNADNAPVAVAPLPPPLGEEVFAQAAAVTIKQYRAVDAEIPVSTFDIGTVFSGRVYQFGLRITIELTQRVYLDYFVIPRSMFVPGYKNRTRMTMVGGNFTEGLVAKVNFSAVVQGRRFALELLPQKNKDINSIHRVDTYRGELAHVSPLRSLAALGDTLDVTLRFGDDALRYAVPVANLTLGFSGLARFAAAARVTNRSSVTLCVGSVMSNGGAHLLDHVRHHMRVGVDHFMFGIHESEDSPEVDVLKGKLAKVLANGTVVLWFAPLDKLQFRESDDMKMIFYQTCLFHAKTVSVHVAAWDVDEWWLPNPLPSAANLTLGLTGALTRSLARIERPACPDWCFATYRSAMVTEGKGYDKHIAKRVGRNPLDFAWIEQPQLVYQKSVARAHNIYVLGFHLFGSCRLPDGSVASQSPKRDACATFDDGGLMYHYLSLFRGVIRPDTEPTRDAFARLVREFGHERLFGPIGSPVTRLRLR